MTQSPTIPALLAQAAAAHPSASALLAPSRDPLTYVSLARTVAAAASALGDFGIGRGDTVAIALDGGCDAATAFLAVASAAIACPLNPQYVAAEFEFRLAALKAKALILEDGRDGDAAAAARKLGVPILRLAPAPEAGAFALAVPVSRAKNVEPAKPDNTALVLHTSGTTARPKRVPLSHANLIASAGAVAKTLALSPSDRGLCVMPLFHIHGLVAALLAPLASGGSIAVPPGFHAIEFFDWCAAFSPSWYTAVPSMHQALLARADRFRDAIASVHFRFIRSSSAPLPPIVLAELERVFRCPVIESYGMTEAAHQMASNPLPPGVRKPGTVGPAAGPEIAILDERGNILARGKSGEVAIRGPNVTAGYLENDETNRAAFAQGWFRTGDLGVLDADGYLTLVARIKEIINRGGEKVAPREVEEALLAHPDVAEAAVFPVPDAALGEEVGAAVVLKPGARTDAATLKEFAGARLAYFKLPRYLLVLDAIPKGATGKIRRKDLAKRLGIEADSIVAASDRTPPRNETERLLCALWRDVLRLDAVGIHSRFLDLGGDSILAAQLVARLRRSLSPALTMADVWDTPTVAAMAERIESKRSHADLRAIRRLAAGEVPPPSFSQEWWLSLDDARPGSAASNRPSSVLIEGALDTQALAQAFAALVARHDALRMSFPGKPGARRVEIGPAASFALDAHDLSALAPDEARRKAREDAMAMARLPFVLDRPPLWRAKLLRLAPATHALAFIVHHAVFDGWSMAILVRDLAALYESAVRRTPPPPALAVQYGDVAAWQRREIAGAKLAALESFWRDTLKNAPRPPALPFAKPRPKRPTLKGGKASLTLPESLARSLGKLARGQNATLYMTLLAAFQALIARYTNSPDVLTGCLVAGRERVECEDLIGLFFNALPIRGNFAGDPSVGEAIARIRDATLAAFAHSEMPIVRLAGEFPPRPGESPIALVPVLFQLRNMPRAEAAGAGVRFAAFPVENENARFDLTFDVTETTTGLGCDLAYNADIFEPADAEMILADFATLCAAFAAAPEAPLAALPPWPDARGRSR